MADNIGRHIHFKVNVVDIPNTVAVEDMMVPPDLARAALDYRVIEEKYWYYGEHGAAAFLSLTKDSKSYMVFQHSLMLLQSKIHKILDLAFDQFAEMVGSTNRESLPEQNTPLPQIDLISLGVGGIDKEYEILRSFLARYRIANGVGSKITFRPVELSFPLLVNAIQSLDQQLSLNNISENIDLKPYLADFYNTISEDFGKNPFRFITALEIVPNATFPDIFNTFRKIMTKKSLLLIDMSIVGNRSDEEICASYVGNDVNTFLFEPLSLLNRASKSGKEIESAARRSLGNLADFKDYNRDKGEIKARIVSTDSLDGFIAEFKLPKKSRDMIRISSEPGSKTVVLVYVPNDPTNNPVVLGYSTRFEKNEFMEELYSRGFDIVDSFSGSKGMYTVYFLLRLADGERGKNLAEPKDSNKPDSVARTEPVKRMISGGKSI